MFYSCEILFFKVLMVTFNHIDASKLGCYDVIMMLLKCDRLRLTDHCLIALELLLPLHNPYKTHLQTNILAVPTRLRLTVSALRW